MLNKIKRYISLALSIILIFTSSFNIYGASADDGATLFETSSYRNVLDVDHADIDLTDIDTLELHVSDTADGAYIFYWTDAMLYKRPLAPPDLSPVQLSDSDWADWSSDWSGGWTDGNGNHHTTAVVPRPDGVDLLLQNGIDGDTYIHYSHGVAGMGSHTITLDLNNQYVWFETATMIEALRSQRDAYRF